MARPWANRSIPWRTRNTPTKVARKVIASSVGVAFALLLITVMLTAQCDQSSKIDVHALWPKRVSPHAEAELVAQLT